MRMKKVTDEYDTLVGKIEDLDVQILKMSAQLRELRGMLVEKLVKSSTKKKEEARVPSEIVFLEVDDKTGGLS